MRETMSTTSKCCTPASVAHAMTGSLTLLGLAVLVWLVFARRNPAQVDPLTEADRRIDALEDSLRRLQDTVTQRVGV